MEKTPKNLILELHEGAIEGIRKIHGLDNPQRLAQAIDILEAWIQKQDHIVKKDFSKKYLEVSLILCKGSVEMTKKQIDRMCTLRSLLPSFFSISNVKLELQDIMDRVSIYPLPKLTNDYYRVIIFKIKKQGFSSEHFKQFYQLVITSSEYIKANDYVNGLIIVSDYSELNLIDLLSKLNTVELQQIITIIIKGYGARVKGIYIITESKAVELLMKILRQLLSEKIGSRIHALPAIEDLQKELPKEILPVEYGGNEKSADQLWPEWLEAISTKEHVEYMKMMNKAGTDESKRHSAKFNEEHLGMAGSFRNLSVD